MTVLTGEPAPAANADFGYRPELTRSLGSFKMFAVAFASVSVIIGIFSTYGNVLQTSGPLGICLFPVVAVGQILVALVYAQFSARIPLTGSSYQWASRRRHRCRQGPVAVPLSWSTSPADVADSTTRSQPVNAAAINATAATAATMLPQSPLT